MERGGHVYVYGESDVSVHMDLVGSGQRTRYLSESSIGLEHHV